MDLTDLSKELVSQVAVDDKSNIIIKNLDINVKESQDFYLIDSINTENSIFENNTQILSNNNHEQLNKSTIENYTKQNINHEKVVLDNFSTNKKQKEYFVPITDGSINNIDDKHKDKNNIEQKLIQNDVFQNLMSMHRKRNKIFNKESFKRKIGISNERASKYFKTLTNERYENKSNNLIKNKSIILEVGQIKDSKIVDSVDNNSQLESVICCKQINNFDSKVKDDIIIIDNKVEPKTSKLFVTNLKTDHKSEQKSNCILNDVTCIQKIKNNYNVPQISSNVNHEVLDQNEIDNLQNIFLNNDHSCTFPNAVKNRMNMEVAYYKAAVKPNCIELIKINENEEIILDMSHEEISSKVIDSVNANCKGVNIQNDTNLIKDCEEDILDIHKSNYNIQNKKNDFLNGVSDISYNVELIEDSNQELDSQIANDPIHLPKSESSIVVTISDSDNSMIDDCRKNDNLKNNKLNRESIEISQIEKVINFNIKLKCLLSIDKNAKEIYQKQIINAICEPNSAPITHQKIANSSTSTCLADISSSDNKDSSPASTNSAFQLHNLQPSRLSFVSSISSSSSASCTVPLTTTKSNNETQFSYRPWPLKYLKKNANRLNSEDKQNWDAFEKLTKEWKNSHIIISTIINFLNNEIFFPDNGSCDNGNSDLTENNQILRSSTPEIEVNKISNTQPTKKNVRNDKVNKQLKNSKIIKTSKEIETNTISELDNEFLEKEVFAKWSDNNYYPGKVCAIIKTKYKVNFFDGKTKLLLPDFILPINKNLEIGSSVYTYSNDDKYASSGLIINIEKKGEKVIYTIETDGGQRVNTTISNIFLTSDQAQLIREQILKTSIVTSTIPQQLSYITLDNVLSSKRRSKKTTVLNIHTTEFQKSSIDKSNKSKPSVSGMQNKLKQKIDNDNSRMIIYNHKGWTKFLGVQNEIINVLQNEIIKGPLSKVKGKSRYPKKVESPEDLEILGPIPEADSNIFKGMTFILSCVSLKTLIRYQVSSVNNDSNSESGTENEEEWVKRPFLRYRLQEQITAGGGKVYDNFEDIPSEEYLHTKHITNVPNLSKNSLLCLSVGIRSYNHQWVIRSCLQNKAIEPAEEELPAGWSLDKQAYIDIYQRPKNRPLEHTIIAIPLLECGQAFVEFWKKICENAGAAVQILENPDKSFMEVTIILANVKCPLWVIEQAKNWHIPILSTTWLVQCLIEGKLCSFDTKQVYKCPLSDSSF